jgi:tRNA modification GTPase
LANELPEVPWLRVRNKADLRDEPVGWLEKNGQREVVVSAKTGAGLDVLRQALLGSVGSADQQGEGVFMARSRHIEALVSCRAHLDVAVTLRDQVEFLAEELRYAEARLGDITGSRTADDLLGDIFRSFCIGK